MRVPPALLLLALLCLAVAAPANARTAARLTLMPGVSYEQRVEFTSRGPVVYHVITAPRPGGLYSLRPYLAGNAILGREQRVTDIEKDVSPAATVAGVKGDLFSADGRPSGILMRGGALDSPPIAGRSSVGFAGDGSLHIDRIAYNGYWQGTGQRRVLGLNSAPLALNGVTLYTPAWGPATPVEKGAVLEQVLSPFPPTAPNSDLVATVTGPTQQTGGTQIPAGGAVLVARGNQIPFLQTEAPVGGRVKVRLTLTPGWAGITDALGGGPLIVRGSKPVFRANELFSTDLLASRSPRTAVGQLADGRIVLVATDGGLPGYSVGMTNFELALTLQRLGAVTASALDSGASTAMAFDGTLLNRSSDRGGEQRVAEA
ncbi:MAG: phosphodiester glycosidase family protein, partial [Gaiellaceae bacterium]